MVENYTDLLGKMILVALNLQDDEGDIVGLKQIHGKVLRASDREGIVLFDEWAQEEFKLPPQLNAIQIAEKGEYRESSTGDVIVDPDFITLWEVTIHSEESGGGTSWKYRGKVAYPSLLKRKIIKITSTIRNKLGLSKNRKGD